MIWVIIICLLLLLFSMPLVEGVKNSNYFKKRKQNKINKSPYLLKWKQLVNEIANAEKYNDWRVTQNLRKELQWLVSINTYVYNEEIKKRNLNSSSLSERIQANLYRETNSMDTVEIQNSVYLKFKESDIVSPAVFGIENPWHKQYAEDIASDFEKNLYKAKSNQPPYLESSLLLPREFIYNALSFFAICRQNLEYKKDGIDSDYIEELQNKLGYFQKTI